MGHISPEQRRPPQTSYGHVGDSIPIQIHDSMYGLTEELHLFTITACRDSLRARTGKQRERERISAEFIQVSKSVKKPNWSHLHKLLLQGRLISVIDVDGSAVVVLQWCTDGHVIEPVQVEI